jgi:hypothetical protein
MHSLKKIHKVVLSYVADQAVHWLFSWSMLGSSGRWTHYVVNKGDAPHEYSRGTKRSCWGPVSS